MCILVPGNFLTWQFQFLKKLNLVPAEIKHCCGHRDSICASHPSAPVQAMAKLRFFLMTAFEIALQNIGDCVGHRRMTKP